MHTMKKNWLILFILAITVAIPPVTAGYGRLASAKRTPDGELRAFDLERAARLLAWRPDLYEQAGLEYSGSGNFSRAILMFNLARQHHMLTTAGQLKLGDAYLNSGDTDNAIREWESLLNEGQAIAGAAQRLSNGYQSKGQDESEKRVLRQWLAVDPQATEAASRLGLLLAASAPEEALPLLEQAAGASPEAASRYQNLISALKSDGPDAYRLTLTGQALANLYEWKLARAAFEGALQADATYAPAWAWLGITDLRTNSPGAQAKLEKAVALDGASAPIRGMLGLYLETEGKLPEAETQYRQAAGLEPQNPAWWLALARILSRRDLTAALDTYQHAIDLDPQNAASWFALAAFCVENDVYIQDYGLDAALSAYALAPETPQYMDMLGRALAASGETDSAEAMFQKAITVAPKSAAPKLHLALLYLQSGRPAQSKDLLEETLQSDRDGPYGTQAQKILARYFP